MDELAERLRAQLDEDERVAPRVHSEDCALHAWLRFDVPSACDCGWPSRIRREVAAKRRILDAYEKALDRRRLFRDDAASAGALLQMVAVVKLLALPYSDRPGRPSTEE